MRSTVLSAWFAAAAGLAMAAPGVHAMPLASPATPQRSTAIIDVANARNPYGNIDRRTDAGNDTGNSEVDRLNSQQLQGNYRGPYYAPGAPVPPPVSAGQPMYPTVPRGYYGR